MDDVKVGPIELRKDEAGLVDDIVVNDVKMFRMEHMDNNRWWIRVYTNSGKDLVVYLAVSNPVAFEVEDGNEWKRFDGTR